MENEMLKRDFVMGRMISHSKSSYRGMFPYNTVVFNANIYSLVDTKLEKIWWGDLDLSLDGDKLKEVAESLGEVLYVVPELAGRFGNEDKNLEKVKEDKMWDTTEPTPKVTPEYIERVEKEKAEREKISKKMSKERLVKETLINKELPIVSDLGFFKEVKIPYENLEKVLEKMRKDKDRGELKDRDYYFTNEHGYLSAYVLDQFLKRELKFEKEKDGEERKILNPSSFWLSNKTNRKLKRFDLEAERLYEPSFTNKDFGREVTCNYCVDMLSFMNDKGINKKSYKEDVIYIRENNTKEMPSFF